MRVLFMMLCVFSLSIGMAFAEGENMAHKDGSLCDELGKTPSGQVVNTSDEDRSNGVNVE